MLKPEYITKITRDKQLRTKIMYVTNKSLDTIYRWLRSNNPMLSTPEVAKVICDHYGVTSDDIFEPVKSYII